MKIRCEPALHRWNWTTCAVCGCSRNRAAKDELLAIAAKLREVAPALRGEGMTASDATFNRLLRIATDIETLAR